MKEYEPKPGDLSKPFGVIVIGCFGSLGLICLALLLIKAIGDGIPDDGLVPFLGMIYVFGICPLWAASMVAYGLRHYLRDGFIRFPDVLPPKLALLGMIIAFPWAILILALDCLLLIAFWNSWWTWSWDSPIFLALGLLILPPVTLVFLITMKRAYKDAFKNRGP